MSIDRDKVKVYSLLSIIFVQLLLVLFFITVMSILLYHLIKSINTANNQAIAIYGVLEGILLLMAGYIFGYYFPKRTNTALLESEEDQSSDSK